MYIYIYTYSLQLCTIAHVQLYTGILSSLSRMTAKYAAEFEMQMKRVGHQ